MFGKAKPSVARREKRAFWAFMAPTLFFVGAFSLYPLLNTIYLSFFKYNIASGTPKRFNGLANYIRLFSQPQFFESLLVTFKYVVVGVVSTMLLGFIMALLLNGNGFIIKILRGVALMPMLICSVALTVAWQLMYNPNFGLFNIIMQMLGLPIQNWLGNPDIALYSLALTDTWQFTPFVMILTLAGFQSISPDYYEAAAIDGANRRQMLFRITLPLMKKVLLIILVMRVIDAFKTFEKPRIMTDGGPMRLTETINLHVYRTAFLQWEFGYGATGAFVVAIVMACLTLFIIKITRIDAD